MRVVRVLAVLIVAVAALFVAADRIAVKFAEDRAAEAIRAGTGMDRAPEVSINGFPFLTQVASGTLDAVDTKMTGIEATAEGRELRIASLSAHFRDVRLTSDYSSIEGAAGATGNARISYADLTKAAGDDVTIGYAGSGGDRGSQVRIKPTMPLLSSMEVLGTISTVGGDTVRLRAGDMPTLCTAVPGCEDKVRARTDHEWTLDGMPPGLRLNKVVTTPEGVAVAASGRNIRLPR